jgi:glyoxylate utilization-related uncharacterized protein
MFIILTNASVVHRGNKVVIRKDLVVSMHESTNVSEKDNTVSTVTYIFCPPHGTWEVEESIQEVFSKLTDSN